MSKRPSRLVGVTLIALGVLTIACLNLLRLVLSLREWGFLSTVESISPLYQALTGLVWSTTGLVLFWGLWRRKHWAPKATGWWSLLYALYYWLDRYVLTAWQKSGQTPANLVFTLGLTLVILAFVFWNLSRPKIKTLFGETHERSS